MLISEESVLGRRIIRHQGPKADVVPEALHILVASQLCCLFNLIWSAGIFRKSGDIAC